MPVPESVEAYLDALPEAQRVALQQLRQAIRAAAPEATEAIAYQMPAFKDRGRVLVYYAAFKDHCSLFPASLAVIDAHRRELEPYGVSKGTIRFRPEMPLPAELVTSIVHARLAENAARRARRGR